VKITVSKNNNILNIVDLGEMVYLGEGSSFLIGRSDECHILLDDKKISRQQAKIDFNGKAWEISNLSDYVNVTVNNQHLAGTTLLNDNDIIHVDDFVLKISELSIKEEAAAEEVSPEPEVEELEPETEVMPATQTEITPEGEEDIETELLNRDEEGEGDGGFDEGGEGAGNTQFVSMDELAPDEESDEGFGDGDGFGDAEDDGGEYSDEEYAEGEYDDYGDDNYAVDEYDDGAGESTQLFSGFAKFSLELFGEHVPYDTYNITQAETFIGRDPEKCQIVLQDPEVSSVHAVIKKNNITCTLEDLQSANGTLLNGKRINSKEVTNGDEFVIGGSTFTVRVGSEFLDSQQGSLMPVEENQVMEVEEIVEVDEDAEDFDEIEGEELGEAPSSSGGSLFSKEALKDPEKRKKLLIYGVVLMALWIFLGDDSADKPKPKKTDKKTAVKKAKPTKPGEKKLTPEQAEKAESLYQLAQAYLNEKKIPEALQQFDQLFLIKRDYKQAQQLYQLAKERLKELEEIEREKQKEKEKAIRKKKVAEYLKKATKAVEERNVTVAEKLFVDIRNLEPENYDVTSLELELNAWKKEKQRKELEEAQKKAERKRMENALAPGKHLYLKEEWFNAIGALEKFLQDKDMDKDLKEEAVQMLKEARGKLSEVIDPLMGKARSLREGEDLKGAYSAYNQVLKYDPTKSEALNELDDINITLTKRARTTYREALVAESLGLFEEAKEKYQEVQQIAPSDNDYYKKATDRLRDL
jgi:pSer/pThr/pTyr-binding forkhead associated (FHA) protein